ncbi:Isochorismatase hydrolase [Lentinus brumalis]|uniref:Isochorismatase hydrolase n=1 Tax=Lentinus brumalis TaxID=2498619 RepID=A0A371CPJ7_9APHY|nr:Isochorismatase hydrolase [Polyporus brumalis]
MGELIDIIRVSQRRASCEPGIQPGFQVLPVTTHWGLTRSNAACEGNLARLVALFRARDLPILHVAHHSLEPGSPLNPAYEDGAGVAFISEAAPHPARDEPVFQKNVNSSFIGTTLEDVIRARGVRTLFVAGLETDRCVSTTVRMGANLGVVGARREPGGGGTIWLVQDAVANFERGR